MDPFVLGIIPARGGSKAIPDKNIAQLAGKPLIAYSIEAAQQSQRLSAFLVSTDSPQIAEIARAYAAPVPFARPKELATDSAKTVDVVRHAVEAFEAEQGVSIDWVVLLQPTAPLRRAEDIDGAIDKLLSTPGARSLISCYDGTHVHPSILYHRDGERMRPFVEGAPIAKRRQEFEPVFVRNGAVYIAARSLVMDEGLMREREPLGYVMPRERSINVDEPFDLELAELLLQRGQG